MLSSLSSLRSRTRKAFNRMTIRFDAKKAASLLTRRSALSRLSKKNTRPDQDLIPSSQAVLIGDILHKKLGFVKAETSFGSALAWFYRDKKHESRDENGLWFILRGQRNSNLNSTTAVDSGKMEYSLDSVTVMLRTPGADAGHALRLEPQQFHDRLIDLLNEYPKVGPKQAHEIVQAFRGMAIRGSAERPSHDPFANYARLQA